MAQKGCLLIADVSGYTAFLTQSELEHAQDILENLFHALLENIRPPLIVSKIEGDAVFCYAPDGSFLLGQTLVEMVENLYHVFTSTRERMRLNTTCTCKACTLIPTLDLKFVVHHGEYGISTIGRQQELQGADVIVVHRLLKNTVDSVFKTKAYAFFTKAAADALKLDKLCAEMQPHTEQYEHLGEVSGYVHDLRVAMERQRERRQVVITPEAAWKKIESVFPVPPALLWDYLNDSERQRHWMEARGVWFSNLNSGRAGTGSIMHCAHGKNTEARFMIEDWKPFEHITLSLPFKHLGMYYYTMHLIPEGEQTRLIWCFEMRGENALKTRLMQVYFTLLIEKGYHDANTRLRQMIEADLQAGRVVAQFAPQLAPAV